MYASLIILYGDIMKNNDAYFLKIIADLPESFGKHCPECAKYVHFKKEHINSIIKCSNCKTLFKISVNIFKAIKLERVDDEPLTRQELNELNASQEDTGSPPRWY